MDIELKLFNNAIVANLQHFKFQWLLYVPGDWTLKITDFGALNIFLHKTLTELLKKQIRIFNFPWFCGDHYNIVWKLLVALRCGKDLFCKLRIINLSPVW